MPATSRRPREARVVYGSDVAYERALAVGRMAENGMLMLLPSTRPAPDVLRSPLPAAGTYLVAAPPNDATASPDSPNRRGAAAGSCR